MSKDIKEKAVTIDEALERTGFGKFNIFIIIFSGFVLNTVVLESVGVSFALPVLECDLHLTHKEQGIIGAASFAGVIASSHFWGFLADTTGRKRIMQPALILGFIVTVFSSLSPNFITFAILRFINGIIISAGSATTFVYLGEFHCQKFCNRAILFGGLISSSLAVFFPIIALAFINQSWEFHVPFINIVFTPWRSYFLACGLPGLLCGVAMFYLPESPKYLLSAGKPEEAIEVLIRMHRVNLKDKEPQTEFTIISLLPDAYAPVRKEKSLEKDKNVFVYIMQLMWHQTAPLFMREHIRKTFLSCLILYIIFFNAHGLYMWFPYVLNIAMQYTEKYEDPKRLCDIIKFAKSGNLTNVENDNTEVCSMQLEMSTYFHSTILEVIYASMLLITMYLVGKFGRKPMLFVFLFVCGACGILAFSVPVPLLAIYLFVIQLCCGVAVNVVNAIVVEIFPTNLRAMAICISLMIGRIGSVTGSNILGILIESHCELALYSPSVALIVAGALGFLLPKANNVIRSKDQENTP